MSVQISKCGPPVSAPDLTRLEGALGGALPDDYKRFLVSTNGGDPNPDHFQIEGMPGNEFGEIRKLLSAGADERYNDLEFTKTTADRLPPHMLPIGYSSTDDLICMSLAAQDHGTVYYWDSWSDPKPASEARSGFSSLYFVAQSFQGFLDNLAPYESFAG